MKITQEKMDEFKRYLILDHLADATVKQYTSGIKVMKELGIEFIPEQLENFIIEMKEKEIPPSTINKYVKTMKAWKRFTGLPYGNVKLLHNPRPDKAPQYITMEELKRIVIPILKLCYPQRHLFYTTLFLCLFETGLRISDMLKIELKDIDFKENKIELLVRKTQKYHYAYFSDATKRVIKVFLRSYKIRKGRLFPVTTSSVRKACEQINLNARGNWAFEFCDKLTPHILRHSCAQHIMLITEGDLLGVKEILGHSSIQTTMRYTRKNQKQVQDIHRNVFDYKPRKPKPKKKRKIDPIQEFDLDDEF